ncbi:hypothetical protein [Gordonia caeni]|uniref:Uncharacterized protein n=1 Tax=Gordonia caeni TaxID=1007097 RepID=A0ABP7NVX3_9ACTN
MGNKNPGHKNLGKHTIRAAGAAACAGVMAAGALAGAGAAAAAPPGDLKVSTFVVCQDGKTVRLVLAENVGGTRITGVRVGSVLGPEVRVVEIKEPNFASGPEVKVGNVPVATGTGTGPNGTLGPGQNFIVGEVLPGCGGPYAIVGYAIGNEIDNVFNAPNFSIDFALAGPVAKRLAG